jgi:hypothetical protein
VADRVAGLAPGDRRIRRGARALVPEARVDSRVLLVPVVGVGHVARAAARGAVVARLVVGAGEPQVRIVQARLGDVDERHGDAAAGPRSAIGLAEIRASGLVELLQLSRSCSAIPPRETGSRSRAARSNTRKTSAGGTVSHAGSAVSDGRMPLGGHERIGLHRRHERGALPFGV